MHRDPAPENLVDQYPNIITWINTLNGDFKGLRHEWETDGNVIESLKPLIQIWAQSHAPLIRQSISAIAEWFNSLSDEEKSQPKKLPKFLGKADIQLGEQHAKRLNLTYGYWMFSRIHHFYHDLNSDAQLQIENLLTQWQVCDLFKQPLPCKVTLHRCRLYLEPE